MKTKVFISWSGKNTASFKIAKKLAEWLPMALQETEPFMSDNIRSGTNPINQIMENLANSKMGIICVTKDNITSPWLNFEAGALNNVVTNQSGIVIPLLINMTTDEFASSNSPIKNLQGKEFNPNDFKIVLKDINGCLENPITENTLNGLYDNLKKSLFDTDFSDPPKVQKPQTLLLGGVIVEESKEEKPYISLLREIVDNGEFSIEEPEEYEKQKENLDILESFGYIKQVGDDEMYINEYYKVKATGKGIHLIRYGTDKED